MNCNITTAINCSDAHNEIVTIEGDESVRRDIAAVADGSVLVRGEIANVTEYWGGGDRPWRVHVRHAEDCVRIDDGGAS
jgi:hypothetical protein